MNPNLFLAAAEADPMSAFAALFMIGGLVLGVCYLIFPFVVMSRLKTQEKAMQDQIAWLQHTAGLQKRQTEALEELVANQRAQGSLPPSVTE